MKRVNFVLDKESENILEEHKKLRKVSHSRYVRTAIKFYHRAYQKTKSK